MKEYKIGENVTENQTEEIDGMELLSLENYKMPTRRKHKRKKRKGSVVMTAFWCIFTLTAVAGCVVLMIRNRALQTEVNEAMAYIDEVNAITVYTEEETREMIKVAVQMAAQEAAANAAKEASAEKEEEILGGIQAMMEEGEGTAAMLRALYPEDVVVASDGRYYFFPIQDSWKKHSYQKEQFVLNEEGELEYLENEEVVSRKGIDVSKYQGNINWKKVAADGVEYAFVRLGIRGSSEGKLSLDDTYKDNIQGALENDIDVGVYFFTQALNKQEAIEEAEFVLEHIEGYDVRYPIVLDVEEITTKNPRTKDMTKQDWTDVCIAFCERIKQAGYTPMIYGNLKTFMLMLDMEQLEEYEKWFAYYNSSLYFPYEFSVWQYTSTGRVNGIKGDVDMNVSMKDWSSVSAE